MRAINSGDTLQGNTGEAQTMLEGCIGKLRIPPVDRRTQEYRSAAETRAELERRLGPNPTFMLRHIGEAIIRTEIDILLLQRQRREYGPLSAQNHGLLVKREQMLLQLMDRLERFERSAPAPKRQPEAA